MGIAADLVLIILAGLAGGLIAHALRIPLLIGYIAAGIAVGPHTAGPTVSQVRDIELLAEIGVALLLFSIGLEVSFRDLKPVRTVAIAGGAAQIAVTAGAGALAATAGLGVTGGEAMWLGAMIALSSTTVVLKSLAAAGTASTLASRVMIGLLIVQDLAVVPMLIVLPELASLDRALPRIASAMLQAALFLALVAVAGTRVLPWALAKIAQRSRELFLVSVVAAGVGVGYAGHAVGLSFALGAFMAGIVMSESELSHQALSDVVPLRDVFGLVFFVTVGMLFDPARALSRAGEIALIVLLIVIGKAAITAAIARAFGYGNMAPFIVGLGLAQIGEFSFVLARSGLAAGAISEATYDLALSCTLVTLAVSPLVSRAALPLGRWWRSSIKPSPRLDTVEVPADGMADHAVVAGCGRTGTAAIEVLRKAGVPVAAIDLNHGRVRELAANGITAVWGDATRDEVLHGARIAAARTLVLTVPDGVAGRLSLRRALALNPGIAVIARAANREDLAELLRQGASVVVQPEFEGGVEMVRQALRIHGHGDGDSAGWIQGLRKDLYAAP